MKMVWILLLIDAYMIMWTFVDNIRHYHTIKSYKQGEDGHRKAWHMAAGAEVMFMIGFITWALLPLWLGSEIPIILLMVQMIVVYWLVHDIGINMMLLKKPFYIGTTDVVDKFVRKLLKDNEKIFWIYTLFKVLILIVASILIIYNV